MEAKRSENDPDRLFREGRTKLARTVSVDYLVTMFYFEFAADYVFPGERHGFWEFIYVDKGEVTVRADEETHVLTAGTILFHRPNEFHAFHASGGTAPNIVVMSFYCDSPAMRALEKRRLTLTNEERDLLAEIVRDGRTAFEFPFGFPLARRAGAPAAAEQRILLKLELFLLSLIDETREEREPEPLQTMAREREQRTLAEAAYRVMERRVCERLTLAKLCAELHVAPSTLKQAFKAETGEPVMKYFLKMKMERAKSMIREENVTIAEIADRLGFASAHYFSRAFKREIGLGPLEYARSVKARTERMLRSARAGR